jgi:hypothetical protein
MFPLRFQSVEDIVFIMYHKLWTSYSLQDWCDLADVPSNPFNCNWRLVVRSHLPASSSLSSS